MRKLRYGKCVKCDNPHLAHSGYCQDHANEYMRKWRKTHSITAEQRKKQAVRSRTRMRVNRGKIIKTPCIICLSEKNLESHHPDYSKPDLIAWLCRKCHRSIHKNKRLEKQVLRLALARESEEKKHVVHGKEKNHIGQHHRRRGVQPDVDRSPEHLASDASEER